MRTSPIPSIQNTSKHKRKHVGAALHAAIDTKCVSVCAAHCKIVCEGNTPRHQKHLSVEGGERERERKKKNIERPIVQYLLQLYTKRCRTVGALIPASYFRIKTPTMSLAFVLQQTYF